MVCLLLTDDMMRVQLIRHIEAVGLKEEGILRIPGSVTRIKVCGCALLKCMCNEI